MGITIPERTDYKQMVLLAATPANPPAGARRMFIDITGVMKWVDSAGVVTTQGLTSSSTPEFAKVGITTGTFGTAAVLQVGAHITAGATDRAYIRTGATGNVGLVVQAEVGQTADLLVLRNSAGTGMIRMTDGGVAIYTKLGLDNASNTTQSRLNVGNYITADAANRVYIRSGAAGNSGLVIQGETAQTAPLFITRNVGGTNLFNVDAAGKAIHIASAAGTASLNIPNGTAPSAPVDGDIWQEGNVIKVRLNGATVTLVTI